MTPLFRKLNLKDRRRVVVLDAPASLEPELGALAGVEVLRAPDPGAPAPWALAFVRTEQEVAAAAAALLPSLQPDAVLWFAYPKGTSRRYRSEINRDRGWRVLGEAGYEAVRQVAIDEDWSALRFRRAEHIRSLARAPERAISDRGRRRASERRPAGE